MLLLCLFEVFFMFDSNFFDFLQKSVIIFQNCFDVFAKKWGIGLSECLYFLHGISVHLLFILGCVWISIYSVVYEAELPPFWREVKVFNEVLGILHDSAVFCDPSSIFSFSNAFRIVGKFGKD